METTTLERLSEEARKLPLPELRRLRNVIDAILANPTAFQTEELTPLARMDLEMLAEGLLSSVPRPPTEEDVRHFNEYVPVEVEGEPVSRTLIRERR